MKNSITWGFSTWKTTLAKSLKDSNLKINTDLERNIILEGFDVSDIQFQREVFTRQIIQELENKENVIFDNSLYTTMAYTKYFYPKVFELQKRTAKNFLNKFPYDNVFYLPPEIPIEDDKVRYTENSFRFKIDRIIKEIMGEFKQDYHIIEWSVNERKEKVLKVLNFNN